MYKPLGNLYILSTSVYFHTILQPSMILCLYTETTASDDRSTLRVHPITPLALSTKTPLFVNFIYQ